MRHLGLKPLRDELSANMDVYLPERSLTRIDKLVRRTGWHNHNLHGLDLKGGRVDQVRGSAFLYNNDLFVGMRMQAGSTSGWHINQYERKIGMLVWIPFKLVGVPIALKLILIKKDVTHS
jgi:hypothetical protein